MLTAEQILEKTVFKNQTKSPLHLWIIGNAIHGEKKTIVNKDDQLLSCEYCGDFRCNECLDINKTAYRDIIGWPDLPWFCKIVL